MVLVDVDAALAVPTDCRKSVKEKKLDRLVEMRKMFHPSSSWNDTATVEIMKEQVCNA